MSERIKQLISEEEIDAKIKEIGEQITKDYNGEEVVLVCVLRGGSFFMCELAKRINLPVSIDFISASSYGSGTQSSGHIKIKKDLEDSIEGKNVIVIEDIIDTGRTLSHLMEFLGSRQPKSLALCTLLDKPDRRVVEVKVDYNCFTVPDFFIVGYGLDYDQKYRNLPFIGVVELDNDEILK